MSVEIGAKQAPAFCQIDGGVAGLCILLKGRFYVLVGEGPLGMHDTCEVSQAGLVTLRLDVRVEFSIRRCGSLKVFLGTVVYRFLGPRRGRRWSRMAAIGTCQGGRRRCFAALPVTRRRGAGGRLADNQVVKAP